MWRDTMRPVRLWIMDARALIPVMIFLLHWRWSTLYCAGAGIAIFTVLEWFGLTFAGAIRTVRRFAIGRVRPAVPAWRKRRFA
jgi:intracellular multiplication protein IcmT